MRSFLSFAFIQSGTNILVGVINYLCLILVARTLGPSLYGEYASAIAGALLITGLWNVFQYPLNYELARVSSQDALYFLQKIARVCMCSKWTHVAVIVFLCYITFLVYYGTWSRVFTLLLALAIILCALAELTLSLVERFGQLSSAQLVGVAVKIVMIGYAIYTPLPHTHQILLIYIATFALFVIRWWGIVFLIHRENQEHNTQKVPLQYRDIFTKESLVHAGATVAMGIFDSCDIWISGRLFSAHEAGLHATWVTLARLPVAFLMPFTSVLYIYFARHGQQKQETKRVVLIGVMLVGLMITGIYGLPLFGALFTEGFGKQFAPLLPFLPLAGLYGTLFSGALLCLQLSIAQKRIVHGVIIPIVLTYALVLILWPTAWVYRVANIITCAVIILTLGVSVFFQKQPLR